VSALLLLLNKSSTVASESIDIHEINALHLKEKESSSRHTPASTSASTSTDRRSAATGKRLRNAKSSSTGGETRDLYSTGETAIINNGLIMLGIHNEGHLNAPGGTPDAHEGETTVGLRFFRDNGWWESTAFGCECEGFGVSGKRMSSGYEFYGGAHGGDGVSNLVGSKIMHDGVSATTSAVTSGNELRVTHTFTPSSHSKNMYQVTVTLENLMMETITDLRYRRVIDWDIPKTVFSECVSTFFPSAPDALEYATDNGFEGVNPLVDVSSSGIEFSCPHGGVGCPVYDSGPADHGALFQFLFKNDDGIHPRQLAPGETFSFDIFFGAANNKEEAYSALSAVDAEIASFGYPSTSGCDSTADGGPNVFMMAFSGVGGSTFAKNVKAQYYIADSSWTALPPNGFGSMHPYKSENVDTINFPRTESTFAGSGRFEDVAALFEGHLKFPSDNGVDTTYRLCLVSDDGAKLYVDNKLAIDNDGLHAIQTKCEDIDASSGIKKISVEYWERGGNAALALRWAPDMHSVSEVIPPSAWV